MSKSVYYIAYLQQDNFPIIPLLDDVFQNELLYKELIDNKILSFKLVKDMSLLINSYSDRSASSSVKTFCNNIARIETKKDTIKIPLLEDLKECNHVLSLTFENNVSFFEEKIALLARKLKGIVIDSKMNTYIPTENGLEKLLSVTGFSAFKKYNSVIDFRQKSKTIIVNKEDKQRWDKNNMIIHNDGLTLASSYDFNILTTNTNLSSSDDIWNELVISHIVGYLSYCTLNNINVKNEYDKYKEIYDLDKMLQGHTSKALIDSLVDGTLRSDLDFYQDYCEISILLLWVLGLTKYPSIKTKCDIIKQASVFKDKAKKDKLYSLIKLKDKKEVLDMFDLTSRLFSVVDDKNHFNKDIVSFHLSAFIFALNYDY